MTGDTGADDDRVVLAAPPRMPGGGERPAHCPCGPGGGDWERGVRTRRGWGGVCATDNPGVAFPLSPTWSGTDTRRQGRFASLRDGLRPPLTPGAGTGEGLLRGGGGRRVCRSFGTRRSVRRR